MAHEPTAAAWLVIAADGYRHVFLERVHADFRATKCAAAIPFTVSSMVR